MTSNAKRRPLVTGDAQEVSFSNDGLPITAGRAAPQAFSLRHGSRTLIEIVEDHESGLYRIAWPDIGLSAPANLTRCMQAARDWAERSFVTDHREISVARRLKSLNNFSWSASPLRSFGRGAP